MADKLKGLRWLGGKNPDGKWGTCQWICSILPTDTFAYVEPFFGMGGIFFSRTPVAHEWVNDIDGRLMNWWRVIADDTLVRQLGEKLERVGLRTDDTHQWAQENIDSDNPVDGALALMVLLQNSRIGTLDRKAKYYPSLFEGAYPWLPERLFALNQRLFKVTVTQRDALEVMDTVIKQDGTTRAGDHQALMYLDPPYQVGVSKQYAAMPDFEAMAEMLLPLKNHKQTLVAISGYADEWDMLDWYVSKREVKAGMGTAMTQKTSATTRTEKLWTNFPPPQEETLF